VTDAPSPPSAEADATDAGLPVRERTTFDFDHRIFKLEGVWFAKTSERTETALYLPMSGFIACIPLKAVRKAFDIAPGSEDDHLLALVNRSIDHYGRITPGDPIPSEVLSGDVSWSITDVDRIRARGLLLDLLHVELGRPVPTARHDEAIRDALQEIAHLVVEKMGDGTPAGEAIRRFEAIAGEYAYVEALRTKFHLIEDIRQAVTDPKQQRRAPRMRESADRIIMLLREPTRIISDKLAHLRNRLLPMAVALKDPTQVIEAIRRTRDDLHVMTVDWAPIFTLWAEGPEEGNVGNKQADGTYRFLAERYLGRRIWRRAGDNLP
jgi:hypothetical protein